MATVMDHIEARDWNLLRMPGVEGVYPLAQVSFF
jgi:hypothetical protein